MPGDRKHHTDKWRRCVDHVIGQGHDESSASAICTTSLQNAGEPIFEAAEAGTRDEARMLMAAGITDQPRASSTPRELHLLGATGQVRYEMLNDRKHLVVPIVALMEGVIHAVNADTPEFVPGDVLKRAASSWIGKPVTLGHPAKAGKQCSASDFEIRKASGIGVIMKSEYQDNGRRLAQEAWIDEEKAKSLHPRMYETLAGGGTEEVSVGAHVVTNSVGSSYNGKMYKGSWLEASGDHLAFLPGGRGACSCEMGCGTFRAASHVITESGIAPMVAESFLALEGKSLDERIQAVQHAVDKWNSQSQPVPVPSTYAYARQVFEDRVIIEVGGKTFSVPYTMNGEDVVFGDKPTEVKQAWVALAFNSDQPRDEDGKWSSSDGEKSGGRETASPSRSTLSKKQMLQEDAERVKKGLPPKYKEALTSMYKEHVKNRKLTLRENASFEEFVVAAAKDYKECPMCQGSGNKDGNPCEVCGGHGELKTAADRIKTEGGKHILYSRDGKLRLAEHLTRAAAEAHRDALDTKLASCG